MYLFGLIAGESVSISLIGGAAASVLCIPGSWFFHAQLRAFIPVFEVSYHTLALILMISAAVGLAAAIPPAIKTARMGIAEGLRHIG
jgi:putative ABC transport system permease protein